MAAGRCRYSCETAAQTLEWINAIVNFIKPYSFLINAHVVNFFQDKLWEAVDEEWINCLRNEPVQNLLLIPCGVVQDYWPTSLKEFVYTLRSLVLPQEQADLQMVIPGLQVTALNSVVTQGMNLKKKHEIEVLSAVVSSVANNVKADLIVDVGSGQVLAFHYDHSVVAIDACSHHGKVTDARAERIKKHYLAQVRKSQSAERSFNVPKTVTCRVISPDTLKALTHMSNHIDEVPQNLNPLENQERQLESCHDMGNEASLILAGLHACGDLSVTMIRALLECSNVKAVVSIGCCYNLLSEDLGDAGSQCGFPMSSGFKTINLKLGKNSRDLACQSAERWRTLGQDAGLHNFELHAFRAAFQMVLFDRYPEVIRNNPSIGRQGKALRRQQQRRTLEASVNLKEYKSSFDSQTHPKIQFSNPKPTETQTDRNSASTMSTKSTKREVLSVDGTRNHGNTTDDKYSLFEKFCESGLCRLGLHSLQDVYIRRIWKDVEPFADLVGPYWSLRAAFGPLLETLILLDRLLCLQEQGESIEANMVPIFDPALSPRNVAIIAEKVGSNLSQN